MTVETFLLMILIVIALIAISYAAAIYNGLVEVRNNVKKAWSNIDVLLKQRYDEIPKLIKICESYMSYERETLDKIMQARERMLSAKDHPAEIAQAEGPLQSYMKKLFALAENYPDLKAQQSFQQLQTRISGLESSISDRREFYNESVNLYNIKIASLPDIFLAILLGYREQEMYRVTEAEKADPPLDIKRPR